jgi:Zn-dependent protease/CBS domain-containing protein
MSPSQRVTRTPWSLSAPESPSAQKERQPSLRWSWRIGSLFGVDLYLHVTFVLLLVWLAVVHLAQGHDLAMAASGLLFVVSVFAVVVLHELGHVLVARRFGIRTRDITLLPIGGVARLERMPEKPSQELLLALAGPMVNLVLALLILAALTLLQGAAGPERLQVVGGPFLAKLLWINVSLGLFNLIPAFPMDGGRALRALFATRMGRTRATTWAAHIGQGIAVLFAVAGLLWNPMLVLIAVFVWMGARQESAAVQLRAALAGIPIGRVMIADFETLSPVDPLARAAERTLAGFQHDFPVVDEGRLVGALSHADLARGLARLGPDAAVGDVMQRRVSVADPAEMLDAALARLEGPDGGGVIVVVRDGQVIGLLTPEAIGELLLFEPALQRRDSR